MLLLRLVAGHVPAVGDLGRVALPKLQEQSGCKFVMKMEFGIRMTREDGVSIFGVDEIQARLKEGAVITALQCKGANFQKTGEDGEHVSLYFSGGSFEIELSDNSQLDAIGN